MFKIIKRILIGIVAVLALGVIGFVVWALWIPPPMPEAIAALESSAAVTISGDDIYSFIPNAAAVKTGLVIYPGARVDARSYAPLARRLAEQGVAVFLCDVPLNLAIFAPDIADEVLRSNSGITNWYVAGHSLGGTIAADYAARNREDVRGLILLASYPLSSSKLNETELRVLSIYGSNDEVATADEVLASKVDLPRLTEWMEIKGGNHSQFGWYGEQSGDGTAAVSREDQTNQIAAAILDFIRRGEK